MHSEPFGQLAKLQGVRGINITSYTSQFEHLPSIVFTSLSRVIKLPHAAQR